MQYCRHLILLFLMSPVLAWSQSLHQTVVKPLLATKESVYDFGRIPQGRPVFHDFIVENQSQGVVQIVNVQASCGCTSPEWSKEPIQAEGKSVVKVGFNAAADGPFEKTIQVFYEGGQQVQLIIKGDVWRTPDQPAPANKVIAHLKTVRIK
jgi:Protein of unknown function (DUF1573)